MSFYVHGDKFGAGDFIRIRIGYELLLFSKSDMLRVVREIDNYYYFTN